MTKFTKEEVLNLQENDNTVYRIILTRLTWPIPTLVFNGPAQLYIQRAPKQQGLPERLATITTKEIVWAEGSWNDVLDDGSIVVEDYQMEIFKQINNSDFIN